MRFATILTVAASVCLPLSAAAEDGRLIGTVATLQGAPLPHLVLVVRGPGGARRVVTGPGGRYRADGLPPGEYTVTSELPGFTLSPQAALRVIGEMRLDLTVLPARMREQVVVAATRGDAVASTLGVSVSALDEERMREAEATDVLHLLDQVPGLSVARAGGVGLQASAFVRGGESRFARVLVDGVPVNEPGGAHNFGTALPLELERVEVVRGAASSLYGTDALAGVVHLQTRRAPLGATPGVHAEAEGGSFAWRRFLGGTSGHLGNLDWNVGLQRLDTDNQEPNSDFAQTAGAASLGASLGPKTSARLVLRLDDSEHGTPGPTAFGRPDRDARYERADRVLGGSFHHVGDRLVHELRASFAATDQLSTNPLDSGSYVPRFGDRVGSFPVSDFVTAGFRNDTSRLLLAYQGEAQVGSAHLLSAGMEVERQTGEIGDVDAESLSPERTNFGLWLQDRVVAGSRVFLTLGGRVERNESYGMEVVPRAAVAVRLRRGSDATVLKASAGGGIKEPSFSESFGTSFFARGNPDLKPERSRTFDVGLEQRLLAGRLRVEATAFHHDYRDQIAFQVTDFSTFAGTFFNLGRTRARGLELALEAAPSETVRVWAEYTYVDSEVLTSSADFDPVFAAGRSLLRRPKHQGSLSARLQHGRLTFGSTVLGVGRRADSDFLGIGLTDNPGFVRVDARLHVRVARRLTAYLASENLTDRRYQEVIGYPALGPSLRLGLRYSSGERRPAP